jgi:hypothetical protein
MTVKRIPSEVMSPRSRACEVVAILVDVIARLHATLPRESDISLGFSLPERLHTTPSQERVR